MTVEDLIIRMKVVGSKAAAGEIRQAEGATRSTHAAARAATVGLATLALGISAATAKAIEWQKSQAQVAGTLRNLHEYSKGNMDAVTSAAESFATHGGFDPETNLSGMTRLLTAHLSVSRAIRDQTLATDMARRANIPYNTAIRSVMNVEQGRTTGLGRLGIVLPKITTAQDALAASHHKVTAAMRTTAKEQDAQAMKVANLRELWKRFGGAAAEYSKTAAGQWSNLQHEVGNLARTFGTAFIPIAEKVARFFMGLIQHIPAVVHWLKQHKLIMDALKVVFAAVIGLLAIYYVNLVRIAIWTRLVTAAQVLWTIVQRAWTAATWLAAAATDGWTISTVALRVAMMALIAIPILALLAAIAFGIYELVTHFHDVEHAAVVAFHWILTAASDVWKWIKGHWPLIAAILLFPITGPVGIIVALFHKQLLGAAKDVWNWLKTAWGNLGGILAFPFVWAWQHVLKPVWGWVRGAAEAAASWFKTAWQTLGGILAAPFKWAWEHIIQPIWDHLSNTPRTLLSWIETAWQTLAHVFAAPFQWAWDHVIKPIYDSIKWLLGAINTLNPFSGGGPNTTGQHAPIKTATQLGLGQPGGHAIRGGRALGGPIGGSGWYDVGEQGKERVFLPRGASVVPHSDLGGGAPVTLSDVINLYMDTRLVGRALVRRSLEQAALR